MKKILIAAVAAAALAGAAGAATAQDYRGPGYDRPGYDRPGYDRPGYDRPGYDRDGRGYGRFEIDRRQEALARRLDRAESTGRMSVRQARALRIELRDNVRMERRFQMTGHGLDRREVAILNNHLNRVEQQLRASVREGRPYGSGYGSGYNRDYDRD